MSKKSIACGDIVPGCDFKAEAESEQELMSKVAKHAAEHHGVKEVTPELEDKLKSAVKTEA
jgi:predicted small metal-binding protein